MRERVREHALGIESIPKALRKKAGKPHHKLMPGPSQEKQTEMGSHLKLERRRSSSRMRIGGPGLC